MRKLNFFNSLLILASLTGLLTACETITGQEKPSEYVDDAGITAQIKAAIFAEPSLHMLQIHVDTLKGVVQLSGFVESKDQVMKAVKLARNIRGVKNVRNDIIVKGVE